MLRFFKVKDKNITLNDAYHGTSSENAQKIIKENRFKPSVGKDQYLGDGAYFFESSLGHAKLWAKKFFSEDKFGIIQANIELGLCLDLNNKEHIEIIQSIVESLTKNGVKFVNDAIAINFLASQFVEIDTVRATYFNPKLNKKIFKGSHFYESALIICVRNLKNIKKIKLKEIHE